MRLQGLRSSTRTGTTLTPFTRRSYYATANNAGRVDPFPSGLPVRRPSRAAYGDPVPLIKTTAVTILRARTTRQNEERLRLGDLWQDHDIAFANRVGKRLDHNNLCYREYKSLLEKAGLGDEGFTFHSLRHTFATELFNQRKRPKIIQSLLGYSSITQTMDTYSHLMERMGGEAVGGLDEAFG